MSVAEITISLNITEAVEISNLAAFAKGLEDVIQGWADKSGVKVGNIDGRIGNQEERKKSHEQEYQELVDALVSEYSKEKWTDSLSASTWRGWAVAERGGAYRVYYYGEEHASEHGLIEGAKRQAMVLEAGLTLSKARGILPPNE